MPGKNIRDFKKNFMQNFKLVTYPLVLLQHSINLYVCVAPIMHISKS